MGIRIGGTMPGAGNTIAFNAGNGVFLASDANGTARGNFVASNSIHDNALLGINLNGGGQNSLGVTANDAGDGDGGVNNLQNFPMLTAVMSTATETIISGTLNSNVEATYRLEFFSNTTIDPSGHGEGETFLGPTEVTTDNNGNVGFTVTLATAAPAGRLVTTTATRLVDDDSNPATPQVPTDTSEFSRIFIDGDFNDDGLYDLLDIDALVAEIAAATHNLLFDLTGDTLVNLADRDAWLAEAGAFNLPSGNPYLLGDANLDGVVDGSDFGIWNANKFTAVAAWGQGDFTADGSVDGSDFGVWNANKFTASDESRGMRGAGALVAPTWIAIHHGHANSRRCDGGRAGESGRPRRLDGRGRDGELAVPVLALPPIRDLVSA
jgi:hypothetical protein